MDRPSRLSLPLLSMLYIKIPKYNELNSEEKLLYHNDEDEYNRRARKGGQILFFAQSEKGETWVPLVEKAFAKLHGDYASLSGGFTGEGIEDMTGFVILPYVRYSPRQLIEVIS